MGPDVKNAIDLFQVSVLNIGTVPSYVSSISFIAIISGERQQLYLLNFGDPIMEHNPRPGTPIEPGRKLTWHFPYEAVRKMKKKGKDVFPVEVVVYDEIGNTYSAPIPESIRDQVFS